MQFQHSGLQFSENSSAASQLVATISSTSSLHHTLEAARIASQVSFSSISDAKIDCEDEVECIPGTVDTYVVGEYHVTSCPICLESFTLDNPAIVVHCKHGFHLQCLEAWRQRSPVCPVCQMSIGGDTGHIMSERNARRRRRYRPAGVMVARCSPVTGGQTSIGTTQFLPLSSMASTAVNLDSVRTGLTCSTGESSANVQEESGGDVLARNTSICSRAGAVVYWLTHWCGGA